MAVTINGESFQYVQPFKYSSALVGGTSGGALPGILTHQSGINLDNGCLDSDGLRPTLNGSGDLRLCTNSDGTGRLAIDVLDFSPNADASLATCDIRFEDPGWQNVADGWLYLFYGNASATQPAAADTYGQYATYHTSVLIACPLNEGSNVTAVDRTSNGLDGTSNNVISESGVVGNGRNFPGSNPGHILFPTSFTKPSSFTMSGWVKPDTWSTQNIIKHSDSAGSNGAQWGIIGVSASTIRIQVSNDVISQTLNGDSWNSTQFPNSVWTHIAASANGTNLRIYRNGVESASAIQTVANSGTLHTLALGRTGAQSSLYYNGGIDEFLLWTTDISADDLLTHYNMLNSQSTFFVMGETAGAGGSVGHILRPRGNLNCFQTMGI
ncbi:MAG: LamG domain-containing protein [Pelagibacteraceae bacterium]